jgi:hypothetical protein
MTAHSELVARLEGASEGSRELDALVWLAINPNGEIDVKRTGRTEVPAWRCRIPGSIKNSWTSPQPVTTSLDAALALAERVLGSKAHVWQIVRFFDRHSVQFGDHLTLPSGEGATAPLAACIALLRAKEPQPDGEKT